MRKVSSGPLLSIDTFSSIQWFWQRTAKALIRLRMRAVWYGPTLSVHAPKAHFRLAQLNYARPIITEFDFMGQYETIITICLATLGTINNTMELLTRNVTETGSQIYGIVWLPFDVSKSTENGKQCRPWSNCSYRSSLIWVYTVCPYPSVRIFRIKIVSK